MLVGVLVVLHMNMYLGIQGIELKFKPIGLCILEFLGGLSSILFHLWRKD